MACLGAWVHDLCLRRAVEIVQSDPQAEMCLNEEGIIGIKEGNQ